MADNNPGFQKIKFVCPFCGAFAQMTWAYPTAQNFPAKRLAQAKCNACEEVSVWQSNLNATQPFMSDLAARTSKVQVEGTMLFPLKTSAPFANPDLPVNCKRDFEEARQILEISPRGAAALLRLVIQKLCIHFGEPGKKINADIASLVRQNRLNEQVQQALDVVRIVGNSSVHPGVIQVEENVDLVRKLFDLVNYIVQEMISNPKQRAALFDLMPDNLKEGIAKRDATKE